MAMSLYDVGQVPTCHLARPQQPPWPHGHQGNSGSSPSLCFRGRPMGLVLVQVFSFLVPLVAPLG